MGTLEKEQCWTFHYHIYKFLEETRDLELARQRYQKDKVDYFWNWMQRKEEMDEKVIGFLGL